MHQSPFAADAAAADAAADAAAAWDEVRADILAFQKLGASALADAPLWSRGSPQWAKDAWAELQSALPRDEDWEVWVDWYEERLRGVSGGEAHDFVFATVPQEEWVKGPAAANAWIKAQLQRLVDYSMELESAIKGRRSLERWLREQPREVAATLAARALLRSWICGSRPLRGYEPSGLSELLCVFLRIAALNRVMGLFPTRAEEWRRELRSDHRRHRP